MSSEDSRRVADYFVVAGLPRENQEPLDEYSLEVNLKPTAYQDPITDITVIFPTLAENVPDYYQMVEMTPGGLSANLNHGSFKSPEVFLCYRRGRSKPPILDIGVIYEGKDKVAPDSQIVEFTPNGYTANINNAQNSQTFLSYRRATEMSPCNELVVMDICVIIASKGEEPPHSFKKIEKTLNRSIMGADVYICYKRSINRPDLISYKPALLHRFPLRDNPAYKLENTVALFCMPMGATLECWPSGTARAPASSSTFVLTLASREKVYGSAITFYEEFNEDYLTDNQRNALNLQKYRSKSDRNVFTNRCICLLSRWPFFEAFEDFLFFLHKTSLMGPHTVPLERFISHFLYRIPFPSPERPRILVQLSPEEDIALFQPVELPLPKSGASFKNLLCNLGPENCLQVLLLALTEQKILFHSLRPSVLTSITEAVIQVIFPFFWQCPYIPLCPIGMSDYLAAPLPFVVGLHSRFFDLYDQPPEVNAIDLDTNTITLCEDKKSLNTKLLPKRAARQLKNSLKELKEKCVEFNRLKHKMEAHNDGSLDFVFKMKHMEMKLEMEIREAFLHFMVSILQGYKSFLLPITKAPTVGATDVENLFDSQSFLKSRDRNFQKFYTMLMKTQMFTKFIEERSFVSETNTSLAFFDECMDRNYDSNNSDSIRYLEVEGTTSDRTVIILPPDASDLSPGKEYKYENFDDLNEKLFLEPEDEEGAGMTQPNLAFEAGYQSYINLANGGDQFATPIAPLAKRTKQEIKSAQKIANAMQRTGSAHPWARCLVTTAYSLWFIHLPGSMLANTIKPQNLKAGLTLLQRMHKLKLYPADEICYRVMMQLCGVYHQPVLAVKVLFEMRKSNVTPNAVTYGYYNKAVLESEWPSGVSNPSQLLWNKLRNVLLAVSFFNQVARDAKTNQKNGLTPQHHTLASSLASLSESKQSLGSKEGFEETDSVVSVVEKVESDLGARLETEIKAQFEQEPTDLNNLQDNSIGQEDDDSMVELRRPSLVNPVDKSIQDENEEDKFRKRLSSIVKPSPDVEFARLDSSVDTVQFSSGSPTRSYSHPKGLSHQTESDNETGIVAVNELNLNQLGNDKEILTKLQTSVKTNGSTGVNRVLFPSDDEDDEDQPNLDVTEPQINKRISKGLPQLDDYDTFSINPLERTPFQSPSHFTKDETLSPGNRRSFQTPPLHKVSSATSMKLTTVPVTENDPLGALSTTNSPSISLSKVQVRAVSLDKSNSPCLDETDILGTPFAEKTGMARSSTMPLDESGKQISTSTTGFSSPSLTLSLSSIKNLTKSGQSKLSSLRKGWTSSPSSKKAQEALSHGVTSIKSAYSVATTTLSKRVEELREYQAPQKSMSPASSSQFLGRDDDLASQGSTGSRRPSEASGLNANDGTSEYWNIPGQIWDQFANFGYRWDGSSKVDSGPQQMPQMLRIEVELFEDLYSKLPKRPPGPVAIEVKMTSCSRCLGCGCLLYDEEIMGGWSSEDSNLNTRCAFCSKSVVPFLTIRVYDYRTRPLSVMANLLTPAPSIDSIAGSSLSLQPLSKETDVEQNDETRREDNHEVKSIGEEDSTSTKTNGHEKVSHSRSASDGNASLATSGSDGASTNSLAPSNKQDELADPIVSDAITVPYLSPLVLRKELENILETEGDTCLRDPDCVDAHPIIYWNLIWFFERIGVKSNIPAMCLKAKSLNSVKVVSESIKRRRMNAQSWQGADHRNIFVNCQWDNPRLYDKKNPPIYTLWRNKEGSEDSPGNLDDIDNDSDKAPLMKNIISGVKENDLLQPIKCILKDRQEASCQSPSQVLDPQSPSQSQPTAPYSAYREILYLTLVAMKQDNIDLAAFDREYRRGFERLSGEYLNLVLPQDRPLKQEAQICRKVFRNLRIS